MLISLWNNSQVEKVHYGANTSKTIKELQAICNLIRSKWNVEKIAIYLRLGEVSLIEPCIVVAISSSLQHKAEIDMQFILQQIKSLASISKTNILKNSQVMNDQLTNNDLDTSNSSGIQSKHQVLDGNIIYVVKEGKEFEVNFICEKKVFCFYSNFLFYFIYLI